jgi:hypothetical protein
VQDNSKNYYVIYLLFLNIQVQINPFFMCTKRPFNLKGNNPLNYFTYSNIINNIMPWEKVF